MADKRLGFGLLGPLEMSVDGALAPLGTPKQRAVLAMLLMNRNNPAVNDRILRQEPLDAKKNAMTTAAVAITVLEQYTSDHRVAAYLNEVSGRRYPLRGSTTIGRLGDNDIVLDSPKVSRHHAVIVDTGTGYTIDDLRSSNGVHVQDQRIRSAATLRDGDRVRICDREFTFQIAADNGNEG